MVQPLNELTFSRPWHWGVAVLGDLGAIVPELRAGSDVAVGPASMSIRVRHAQDIDAEVFEGDWDWSVATFHMRTLLEVDEVARTTLCDRVLHTPSGEVGLGDADGVLTITGHGSRTRVRVSVDEQLDGGLEEIWIDLIAAT